MHNVYRLGLTATFILLISIFVVGCTGDESSSCISNLDDCQTENYDLTEKVEELEDEVETLQYSLDEAREYIENGYCEDAYDVLDDY